MVLYPNHLSALLNALPVLELRAQQSSKHFRRKIAGANVYPAVLVHLPPKKFTSICAFFTNNLSPLNQCVIVDEQRTTLPTSQILGFMEAKSRPSP